MTPGPNSSGSTLDWPELGWRQNDLSQLEQTTRTSQGRMICPKWYKPPDWPELVSVEVDLFPTGTTGEKWFEGRIIFPSGTNRPWTGARTGLEAE